MTLNSYTHYKFWLFITALLLLLFCSTLVNASEQEVSLNKLILAESEGCRDCVRGYDCNTINRRCNKTCDSKLFTETIDLESCRFECVRDWEKCTNNAKAACSFYCKE